MDGFRLGGAWAGNVLHNAAPEMDWVGLGRYIRSLRPPFVFVPFICAACLQSGERGVTQYKSKTMTFECADCHLEGSSWVTCAQQKKMTLWYCWLCLRFLCLFFCFTLRLFSCSCSVPSSQAGIPCSLHYSLWWNKHCSHGCTLSSGCWSYKKTHLAAFIYQWICAVLPLLSHWRIGRCMIKGTITVWWLLPALLLA